MDQRSTDAVGWSFNLAIFRIVYLAFAVLPFAQDVLKWTSNVMPGLPRGLWVPISFYRYIPFDLLTNAGLAHWLAVANVMLIILAVAGALTRYTLGLATVLSCYLFGLMQNQGKVDHVHHIVWFMALLAIGPSGHLLSIDAIVRAIRRADRGTVEPEVPGLAALWTLRYTWTLFGLLYLVPGLAKLQMTLVSNWTSAENLRHLIWSKWFELSRYEPGYEPGFILPALVAQLPSWILTAFGWGSILFEVGFIMLVLLRSSRWLVALSGIMFHELNGYALGIFFTDLEVGYVCLFDWSALGRSFATWRRRQPLVILYDGGCELCRRTIAILGTIDVSRALGPVVGLSDDPRRRQYPEVTDEMLARDMYVLREGKPLRGYDAYLAIAERMPILWPLSLIMKLSPVATVGQAVYRRVADTRRCSIAPHQPAAILSEHTRSPLLHCVGASLIIAQTFFSVTTFSAGMRFSFLPKPVRASVRALLAEYTSLRLAWPFDTYPTFSNIWPDRTEVWEARVVFADGREMRVPADAYATFCEPSQCTAITQGVLEEKDSIRHRQRSLELVRQLWRYEAARVGADAVSVRVYHARYCIDPGMKQPLEQRRMHEFPIAVISYTLP